MYCGSVTVGNNRKIASGQLADGAAYAMQQWM